MFCNKCGNQIDETKGMKFCNKCGNDLSEIIAKNGIIQEVKTEEVIQKVETNVEEVSPEVKKKRKRNLWITIILTCGIWTIFCWAMIIGFGSSLMNNLENLENMGTTIEEDRDNTLKDEDDDTDLTENKSDVALSKEESAKKFKENGKRVGSDEYGYVSVPKNWGKFYDVNENDMVQYSYANVWITTLFAVDEEIADASSYASNVYSALEEDEVENLKIEKVAVNNYEAYQVTCYYKKENIFLACWFIDGNNGKTHYIAVEGPDATSNYFSDIILTFAEDE